MTRIVGHDAGAGDRGEHQQEDHRRQGHGEIDEAHGDGVDERPPKRRDRADEEADDERDRDRDDGDQQRNPAALQQPGQDIAADAVGAEPVRGRRPVVHGQQIDVVGRVRPTTADR